ncbi:sporulation integral membrane protein YtvI [Priestia endophytica]|jgi:sporulation integral membrane protein YtvI|uniref:sporulation integral membrane protein YtvI n=1 Tax=Priestia endophytica TaxID=135735 RepID=UPI000DCA3BD5|nr:sporulation integral membrane protein YtvI [Priestia endophytica]RAS82485.1 sporulation integral membrane protein YtvI [Priestia endophytica]
MNSHYVSIFGRILLVVSLTILSFWFLYHLSHLIYPFIIAFILSLMINPFVNLLENRLRFPRSLAILTTLLLLFCSVAGILVLLFTEIVAGAEYLAKSVPQNFTHLVLYIEQFLGEQIIPLYNKLSSFFNSLENEQQIAMMTNIQNVGDTLSETVGTFIQRFLQSIPIVFTWLPNAATFFIFSLLATFFISKDLNKLKGKINKVFPPKVKKSLRTIVIELKFALTGFLKAQLTLISITTIIVLIGLLILRIDYAITIALIVGFVDLLPYLGTGVILVPWALYSFLSGNNALGIGLLVLYVVVAVQRQIMEPKVLSSSIGIDPLATLIAVFIGFQLFGFFGLIIGPTSLVLFNTIHKVGVFHHLLAFILDNKKKI